MTRESRVPPSGEGHPHPPRPEIALTDEREETRLSWPFSMPAACTRPGFPRVLVWQLLRWDARSQPAAGNSKVANRDRMWGKALASGVPAHWKSRFDCKFGVQAGSGRAFELARQVIVQRQLRATRPPCFAIEATESATSESQGPFIVTFHTQITLVRRAVADAQNLHSLLERLLRTELRRLATTACHRTALAA